MAVIHLVPEVPRRMDLGLAGKRAIVTGVRRHRDRGEVLALAGGHGPAAYF